MRYALPSLRPYAFQTPTSLADLTTYTSIGTLTLLVYLLRFAKSVAIPYFSNVGRKAARLTHGPQWEVNNQVRIQKFGEYVFRLLFHSSISFLDIYLFWNEPWWGWLSFNSNSINNNDDIINTTSLGKRSLFMDYPFQQVKSGITWFKRRTILKRWCVYWNFPWTCTFNRYSFDSPAHLQLI